MAALLLTLLPGDITYVCVTGLFLAMKVKNSGLKKTVFTFNLEHLSYLSKAYGIWTLQHLNGTFGDQAKIINLNRQLSLVTLVF